MADDLLGSLGGMLQNPYVNAALSAYMTAIGNPGYTKSQTLARGGLAGLQSLLVQPYYQAQLKSAQAKTALDQNKLQTAQSIQQGIGQLPQDQQLAAQVDPKGYVKGLATTKANAAIANQVRQLGASDPSMKDIAETTAGLIEKSDTPVKFTDVMRGIYGTEKDKATLANQLSLPEHRKAMEEQSVARTGVAQAGATERARHDRALEGKSGPIVMMPGVDPDTGAPTRQAMTPEQALQAGVVPQVPKSAGKDRLLKVSTFDPQEGTNVDQYLPESQVRGKEYTPKAPPQVLRAVSSLKAARAMMDILKSDIEGDSNQRGAIRAKWDKLLYTAGVKPANDRTGMITQTGALLQQLQQAAAASGNVRAFGQLQTFSQHFPQYGDSDAEILEKIGRMNQNLDIVSDSLGYAGGVRSGKKSEAPPLEGDTGEAPPAVVPPRTPPADAAPADDRAFRIESGPDKGYIIDNEKTYKDYTKTHPKAKTSREAAAGPAAAPAATGPRFRIKRTGQTVTMDQLEQMHASEQLSPSDEVEVLQ